VSLYSCVSVTILLILELICAFPVHADTLVLADSLLYGKLIRFGTDYVLFAPGCGAAQPQSFETAKVQRVEVNSSCLPSPPHPYSAGGEICKQPRALYEVALKSPDVTVAATQVQVAEGRIHFVGSDGTQVFHGPLARVASLTRRLYCADEIPTPVPLDGFCIEARQWAVNFGLEPVFGNKIFTRGFSIYLEHEDGSAMADDEPMAETIRLAFQTAVTLWTNAVYERRDVLPKDRQKALDPMISHSASGYTLLVAPQVVRSGCPDVATFVVRYISTSDTPMRVIGQSKPKAARAEVEGRTLLINGFDYRCWKADFHHVVFLPSDPRTGIQCYNLATVLEHELGHAFGLAGHRDDPANPSIMDSIISDEVAVPTNADADDLIAILLQPVNGLPPGRLDADGPGVEIAPKKR
jgi:hypothetical protein